MNNSSQELNPGKITNKHGMNQRKSGEGGYSQKNWVGVCH